MTETPLDLAHAAMQASSEDETARLRFFERLAETEVHLMLAAEPQGDQIEPEVFDLSEGRCVLVFDLPERLADFSGKAVPYAALPGRALVQMLAGQSLGLALNLEVAPSAMLLPPEAVAWLADLLQNAPEQDEARYAVFEPPRSVPEVLITALDAKLARAGGLVDCAYLAQAQTASGGTAHVLALVAAVEAAEPALAAAVNEALAFSGLDAGALDVVFLGAEDPRLVPLAKVGLRFDLPAPEVPAVASPKAPGMDPDKPPRLV